MAGYSPSTYTRVILLTRLAFREFVEILLWTSKIDARYGMAYLQLYELIKNEQKHDEHW